MTNKVFYIGDPPVSRPYIDPVDLHAIFAEQYQPVEKPTFREHIRGLFDALGDFLTNQYPGMVIGVVVTVISAACWSFVL